MQNGVGHRLFGYTLPGVNERIIHSQVQLGNALQLTGQKSPLDACYVCSAILRAARRRRYGPVNALSNSDPALLSTPTSITVRIHCRIA